MIEAWLLGGNMARIFERIDGFLGRLLFRAAGLICLIIAATCLYVAWWHVERRETIDWLVPSILFALAGIAAAAVVPYCFSRKRSFIEALDAMESEVPDMQPRSRDRSGKS